MRPGRARGPGARHRASAATLRPHPDRGAPVAGGTTAPSAPGAIGSIGCRHRVLGGRRRGERRPRAQCRHAGAGVAGGLGGRGPLHEGALHELQAGHVGRRVAAVPATGVPAGPDPVPAVPGAQGRRRDAEPAGRPGDRQVGLVHVSTEASIFCVRGHPRCFRRRITIRQRSSPLHVTVRRAGPGRGGVRPSVPASWGVQGKSFHLLGVPPVDMGGVPGVDTTGRGRSPSRRTARKEAWRERSGVPVEKPRAISLNKV